MIRSSLLLALLFLPMATMAACPLGAKETRLNVNRLMRNFGKAVSDADYICFKAKNPIETVTDSDINEAINKLDMGIECAEEVLKDPTGEVLPGKLLIMTDEKEKAELVDDYVYFMTDFKDALIEYRDLYKALLAQKPSERNFTEVDEKRKDVDNLVMRAHKKL
jgi:hypothetical protein